MTRRLSALVPVAAALVLVTAAGSADAPTRTVTMPGKAYDPTQLSVLVGTSVTWKNDDAINHTVTADGDAFSSGYVPPGGTFTFTFAKQGRYAFHCTIHKFMRGRGRRLRAGAVRAGGAGRKRPASHLRGARASGHRVGDAPRCADRRSRRARTAGRELRRRRRCRHSGQFPRRRGAPRQSRRARGGASTGSGRSGPATRIQARATPPRPGATAVLQTYDRDHFTWRGIARAKLDGRSRVRFSLPDGIDRVHVVVLGTKGWADGVSRTVRLSHGT